VKLHEQRAFQTHRHATLALDVSQINRRTTVAHLPTEDTKCPPKGTGAPFIPFVLSRLILYTWAPLGGPFSSGFPARDC
jgi:hypothetical protein